MIRSSLRSAVVALGLVALVAGAAQASHQAQHPKKHRVFYHLNEAGVEKARAVLVNMQNHVDVVGWQNIEALELVVHGPALRTFLRKDFDPDIKAKLEVLLTGGVKLDACQITMQRQKLTAQDLIESMAAVPSGVARVMELQEQGYTYIKP
ncbi:MAG: DsrE family protein [Candidatus Rokubacteria bacterium]|nr:DsrE family protein [Candidatus Rokubacteria bacterium]